MSAPAPFSPRMALLLVAGGAALFLALLVMVGTGFGDDGTNNGGGHGAGRGLNGFASFARLAKADGYQVSLVRHASGLGSPGLLVLTPPADANGADIDRIVSARRHIGPTLIILPKWRAKPASSANPAARKGWVDLAGVQPPGWQGFLDDITITVAPMPQGHGRWSGLAGKGQLPTADQVLSGIGKALGPMVTGEQDGRILAGYEGQPHAGVVPLLVVFEPDLLDNYGMADSAQARFAQGLLHTALGRGPREVAFDLTLNGLARSPNLLTLAFTPPFLAATLCLLLAALAVGWRAFVRFGPPLAEARDIALGKTALVDNSARLIRRARRLGLLPAPYVEAARGRMARALGLPRLSGSAALDAAIDRALAARQGGATSGEFSETTARLLAAHGQNDLLRAARDLHALERKLTR